MARRSFFTMEMGIRLRQIRISHHLTMDTVAERMGLIGKNSYTMLTRLETGMVSDPRMSTVASYLAACGANWTDFVDVLNKVKPVLVKPGDAAKVRAAIESKPGTIPAPATVAPVTPANPNPSDPVNDAIHSAERDATEYKRKLSHPRAGSGLHPETLARAAEHYQEFTLRTAAIRRKVLEYLCTTKVNYIYYNHHQTLAAQFHRALHRASKLKQAERKAFRFAQGMNQAYEFARKFEIDPDHAEAIRQIVADIYENWQAQPPTADSSESGN
jgi:transcriptional regulator with XRE-family HTH domain